MFDRLMHTNFFNFHEGGYVLGYQHIFWFYSHPAVYIMMLPGFGIASEVISVFSRKPIFGYRLMALSLCAILVLGFSVWAHHMFVSGMASWLRVPMMVTTLLIADSDRDQGVLVAGDDLGRADPLSDADVMGARLRVDVRDRRTVRDHARRGPDRHPHVSDTYFVVAHIHYVLLGGSLFTIFAGIYYWFPKMTGRMYNERLGKLHFWLTFVGFNLTFFPMHIIGVQGMPRRVSDYGPQFSTWNMVISISSFFLGVSFVVFLYNAITSWIRGPIAEANPWHAMTLEWQVSSPPPIFNFDEIPQIVGGPYEYGVPGARHAVFNGSA